jgi:SHS2 domain-containing protein
MVFVEFNIDSWTTSEIVGRARGERFDMDRHEFRTAVKAATYHQFESHAASGGGWEFRVFVDV